MFSPSFHSISYTACILHIYHKLYYLNLVFLTLVQQFKKWMHLQRIVVHFERLHTSTMENAKHKYLSRQATWEKVLKNLALSARILFIEFLSIIAGGRGSGPLILVTPNSFSAILVVKNIILRQRAAVYVSDGGLHGHSLIKARFPILLSVWHGGEGFRHGPRNKVWLGAAAVGLTVDGVQVLGDADAATIHQELRQEMALRSCEGIKASLTMGRLHKEK